MEWIEAEHELVLSVRAKGVPYSHLDCGEYALSGKCCHPLTFDGLMEFADGEERHDEG